MASTKRKRGNLIYNDIYEPPEKKIISEGEILIKDLVKKQTNTQTNLKEALLQKKKFEKSCEYNPITNNIAGTKTYSEFEKLVLQSDNCDKYYKLKLTSNDIELINDLNCGESYVFEKYKNCDPYVLRQRIQIILYEIENFEKYTEESSNQSASTSRHYLENALCMKPNSTETKLLKFASENKKSQERVQGNPINVKEIEKDIFKKSDICNIQQIRRKARKLYNRIYNVSNASTSISSEQYVNENSHHTSTTKWDVKSGTEKSSKRSEKTYLCSPQNLYTIKNNEIVKLKPEEARSNIAKNKLSLAEIKALPKFSNYEAGNPSKKLYIKNLPNSFDKVELINICHTHSIFNVVQYQIMNGKMKGQAFLTFKDITAATDALEELNGILIKSKPVIVQYGRVKNS